MLNQSNQENLVNKITDLLKEVNLLYNLSNGLRENDIEKILEDLEIEQIDPQVLRIILK